MGGVINFAHFLTGFRSSFPYFPDKGKRDDFSQTRGDGIRAARVQLGVLLRWRTEGGFALVTGIREPTHQEAFVLASPFFSL